MPETPPKKPRKRRRDAGQTRGDGTVEWRGTVYLSRKKFPDKEIADRIDKHLGEFPDDSLSKLFSREMAARLDLPLTQEVTLFKLIERMIVAVEDLELQVETLTETVNDLKSSGASLGRGQPMMATDREPEPQQKGGKEYLGNLFGSMSRRTGR